jgi:hypothetical protein
MGVLTYVVSRKVCGCVHREAPIQVVPSSCGRNQDDSDVRRCGPSISTSPVDSTALCCCLLSASFAAPDILITLTPRESGLTATKAVHLTECLSCCTSFWIYLWFCISNLYYSWRNLHLVPRLRMRGAIPSYSVYVFMERCAVKHSSTLLQLASSVQWVPSALSPGVRRPGRATHHSPPSSSEIKNAWSYAFTPHIRLNGVKLS